ncbi:MAG: hypothetical protein ACOH1Y_14850 [Propionicimonas sp.]
MTSLSNLSDRMRPGSQWTLGLSSVGTLVAVQADYRWWAVSLVAGVGSGSCSDMFR